MSLKALAAVVFSVIAAVWFFTDSFLSADRSLHAGARPDASKCCSTGLDGTGNCCAEGSGVAELLPAGAACEFTASRPNRSTLASRRREIMNRGLGVASQVEIEAQPRDS